MVREAFMRFSPLLLLAACASSPGAADRLAQVPSGDWGGPHVQLTVADTGGTVEFDCAHGSLGQPLALDDAGHFDVPGTLVSEAGPTQKEDTRPGQAVRYRGSTDGQKLSLEVALASGESGGSFSLTRGGTARLLKCR